MLWWALLGKPRHVYSVRRTVYSRTLFTHVATMSQPKKLDPPSLKHLHKDYFKVNDRQRQVSVYAHPFISLSVLSTSQSLQELIRHHIESFNFVLEEGLAYAVQVERVILL